jgi:hypothetical protein
MAPLTVTVDLKAVLPLLAGLSGPEAPLKLGACLREAALFGERQVADRTPVRTGAARASIQATQVGPLAWRIASPLSYITPLEEGSRPHVIRPRRGRFLAFVIGGRRVFARSVRHPGTTAARMFARSVPVIEAAIPWIVGRHFGGRLT